MKRVFVCSPYAGDRERNHDYLMECLADSIARGEAPFAPHAIYPLVLDDNNPDQRRAGIDAGKAWLEYAEVVAVYEDFGISNGMAEERNEALAHMIEVEYRRIK